MFSYVGFLVTWDISWSGVVNMVRAMLCDLQSLGCFVMRCFVMWCFVMGHFVVECFVMGCFVWASIMFPQCNDRNFGLKWEIRYIKAYSWFLGELGPLNTLKLQPMNKINPHMPFISLQIFTQYVLCFTQINRELDDQYFVLKKE